PAPPSATEALEQIHTLIGRALAEADADWKAHSPPSIAIGIAVAGQVDTARGLVRQVRLASGWEDFPLAHALAERWGGPVVLLTTTQAATLAEARLGAGRGRQQMIYLWLGRSVAAGLLLHGTLYAGAHGAAGNLAHWQARSDGPRCSCGARGHLEPIASAQSLVRIMIGRAVDAPASEAAMLRVTGGRAEAMTAEQVVRLAAAGDPVAAGVVGEALDALAPALANLVVALDPDLIVLGGPLAGADAGFVLPLAARLAALCEPFMGAPPLLAGELDPVAALVGALLAAREAQQTVSTARGVG
ncbi:MAG TPA: ROK family protein, partial [Ktedonobacterales bacterium]